ncbi:exodeoxyribonuclease VII large subunit, partial [Paracoccus marcusii]
RQQLASRPMPAAMLRQFTHGKRAGLDRALMRLEGARARRLERPRDRLAQLRQRLDNSLVRVLADTRRVTAQQGARLADLDRRLVAAMARIRRQRQDALVRLDRMRLSLGHEQTLRRGFVILRDPEGGVITTPEVAARTPRMEVQFAGDRRVAVRPDATPEKPKRRKPAPPEQKTLI